MLEAWSREEIDYALAIACCLAGVVALIASFVLGGGRRLFVEQTELVWQFPEKEDKVGRRIRWAKVARYGDRQMPKPLLASPVLPKLTVDEVINAISKSPLVTKASSKFGLNPKQSLEMTMLARERVRAAILKVLMDAGAPKSLRPIDEDDEREDEEHSLQTHDSQEKAHHLDARSPDLMPSPVAWLPLMDSRESYVVDMDRVPCAEAYPNKVHPKLALEEEAVMKVGRTEVSRELLWAALTKVSVAGEGASAHPHPNSLNQRCREVCVSV